MAKITVNTPRPTTRTAAWEAAEAAATISVAPTTRELPPKLAKRLLEWEGVDYQLLPNRREVVVKDITGRTLSVNPLDMKSPRTNKVPPLAFFTVLPGHEESQRKALEQVRGWFKQASLERLAVDKVLSGGNLPDHPALTTAIRNHIDKNIVDCIA